MTFRILALCALLCSACGSGTDSNAAPLPASVYQRLSAARRVYAGWRDGSLYALRLTDAGELEPWGPKVADVTGADGAVTKIVVAADASRVVLQLDGGRVFFGDGQKWHELTVAGSDVGLRVARGATAVWVCATAASGRLGCRLYANDGSIVSEERLDDALSGSAQFTPDGKQLFEGSSTQAPHDSGQLVVRTMTGTVDTLLYSNELISVVAAFNQAVLIDEPLLGRHWIDTTGSDIDGPKLDMLQRNTQTAWVGNQLVKLSDDLVSKPVLTLPSELEPDFVVAASAATHSAVLDNNGKPTVCSATGCTTYDAPTLASAAPISTHVRSATIDASGRVTAVVRTFATDDFYTPTPDALVDELWWIDGATEQKVELHRIRARVDVRGENGAAAWIADGTLHLRQAAPTPAAEVVVASDYKLDDARFFFDELTSGGPWFAYAL